MKNEPLQVYLICLSENVYNKNPPALNIRDFPRNGR